MSPTVSPGQFVRMLPWVSVLQLLLVGLVGCDSFVSVGTLPAFDGGEPGDPEDASANAEDADAAPSDPIAISIDECEPGNRAGLVGARLAAAQAGGALAADARMLYPYEGTVFPSTLSAPPLMWSGPGASVVYLEARTEGLRYQGCLLPSGEHELTLPSSLWRAAARAAQSTQAPLELELTTITGDQVSGPLRLSVALSTDPFAGSLYYMSYGSQLAGAINLGALMRLPLGGSVEPLLAPQGGCAGCHAVSANGAVMIGSLTGVGNSYDAPGAALRDPSPRASLLTGAEFAAIDPTGTFYLATAHPGAFGPRSRGASPQPAATLFELASGAAVFGTGIPEGAVTPAFSPDGKWLAFNDAADAGHTLALMAFSAQRRQASEYRMLMRDSALYPAWPTFRPGGEQLVFALGVSTSYSADGALISALYPPPGPSSDLYIASLDGTVSTLLFRAMGFSSAAEASRERTYLPFGQADLHQNYNPNILPARAGAHDWLFFDSVRNYGGRGLVRGIWCAALDVNSANGLDPSHPPFYLPGQEEGAASLRPIAARRDELR